MSEGGLLQRLKRTARRAVRRAHPHPQVPERRITPEHRLLRDSPLFDDEWYRLVSGCPAGRDEAVDHYLRRGRRAVASPHPLFVPDFYSENCSEAEPPELPFLHFLQNASAAPTSPSPLLETAAYLRSHPEASRHPQGVLGHFQERLSSGAGAWSPSWLPGDAGNLDSWVRARGAEWAQLRATAVRPAKEPPTAGSPSNTSGPSTERRRVTVILVATAQEAANQRMLSSVLAQHHDQWELVVVHDERTQSAVASISPDARITIVPQSRPGSAAALNEGLSRATGEWVAWICDGDTWQPTHLTAALSYVDRTGAPAVCTAAHVQAIRTRRGKPEMEESRYVAAPITRANLAGGQRFVGSALLVSTQLARSIGGFDETLPNAFFHDFAFRLSADRDVPAVPVVSVARDQRSHQQARAAYYGKDRPTVDHTEIDSWHDLVLNRYLIDWDEVARQPVVPGRVSIIMATYADWSMTCRAVETVMADAGSEDLQLIVVDNGCDRETAAVLDSLPLRYPRVQVLHNATNHGFALGNNLAVPQTDGEYLLFLNNDTEVYRRWIGPLLDALKDPEVLGAQSLLLYPSGSIQVAGVVFPECGGVASPFLRGFPREDARGIESLPFRALSAAAMAVRRSDFIELRGFDPLFRNGMEDVDLGLRLSRLRPGRFCVRGDSLVVHHESKTPGRQKHIFTNRQLLLDRWGTNMPGDDVEMWGRAGYSVLRHEVTVSQWGAAGGFRRWEAPSPVLARRASTQVNEHAPRLRWAIKNPAPAHEQGEHWGDTAFARHLSTALRGLGQEVVIDNRDEFERATGDFDDVTLLLRGLTSYTPIYGPVNLTWLISHPENFHRSEAERADLVFAASHSWAKRKSQEWDLQIEPLLQATDPSMFHPDRALPDTGHPVLFVGGSRRVERPIILEAAAADLPLTVYGPDWEDRLPGRFVKATSFPNDDLGAAYRAAGVVLNDHWEIMRTNGFVSNRLFDAVASGARVISDRVDGIEELFGRSVQVAEHPGDVARLASLPDPDSVFGDDEERRRNAARIHAEHSFDVRAKALLEGALRTRATLSDSRRHQAATERAGGAR